MPLFDLPLVTLNAQAHGTGVRVLASTDVPSVCLAWEADGTIEGEGPEVT